MGITNLSLKRINDHLLPGGKILLIGCQNLYNAENYGEVAQDYFRLLGYEVKSLDILGCQGADQLDLREDLQLRPVYDMVNDCGSKEHIDGPLYQPFKNMHEACKVGGVMIHENPKVGNWPGHGQHYFTEKFYKLFAKVCGYDLLEVCSEPAMGNDVDGWNVCAVLRKADGAEFISEDLFNEIYKDNIKSK